MIHPILKGIFMNSGLLDRGQADTGDNYKIRKSLFAATPKLVIGLENLDFRKWLDKEKNL